MNSDFYNHIAKRMAYFSTIKNSAKLLVVTQDNNETTVNLNVEGVETVRISHADLERCYDKTNASFSSQIVSGSFDAIYLDEAFIETSIYLALYRKLAWGGYLFTISPELLRHVGSTVSSELGLDAVPSTEIYTGGEIIKSAWLESRVIDRYDYIPKGLENPHLVELFDTLMVANPMPIKWPYLRKNSPHIWRVDSRCNERVVGVLSTEEGAVLYALAKLFAGKRVLEIGCHFGFSTAHLAKAQVILDVIDPRLSDPFQQNCVKSSLNLVTDKEYRLWPGFSPGLVAPIATANAEPWSMAFIDGDHDGEAPSLDAIEVMKYMADDAVIVFHDMHSPFVYAGFEQCRAAGWNVLVYNSMQGLGIAYRGNVTLPKLVEDISMPSFKVPAEFIA
ncbi:class I SAM-dependent methyltransferase [Shewanella waksmanii]|uniref:class I SAM-dependent methyltransferase n=1 Tax=Shewanella waksmanii TaxID=213783 RepID=UPI0004B8EF39|nr:class I SAM-dependent methyltransferase [Shewanella waksmanii]